MLKEALQKEEKLYQLEIHIYTKEKRVPEILTTWVNIRLYPYNLNIFKRYLTVESKYAKNKLWDLQYM